MLMKVKSSHKALMSLITERLRSQDRNIPSVIKMNDKNNNKNEENTT